MSLPKLSRRRAMVQTAKAAGVVFLAETIETTFASAAPPAREQNGSFRFCLNTATIRGQKLGIVRESQIAAQAGYDGIEPWVSSLDDFVKDGGSLGDLKKQIADSGLAVESAIAFPEWAVDDDSRRAKGLERARREMDMVARIGGRRMAAPPSGATDLPKLDLLKLAGRYRALLEIGEQFGLVIQLELWGFSKNLSRLGECVCVAMETGHRNACVLADVFHLYKSASDLHGISLLGPTAIQVLHMNDFPADPPREKIDDSYRVYPGEGTAPLVDLLTLLRNTGGQKVLSIELFNRKYWSEDPLTVARTGLARMKSVAAKIAPGA